MQNRYSNPTDKTTIVAVLEELVHSLRNLAKSEARLIRTEVKSTLVETGKDTLLLGLIGILIFLGFLPFLAFLIIFTGQLLGGNYWLSALLVSFFFTGIGISLGAVLAKRLTKHRSIQDVLIPNGGTHYDKNQNSKSA